MPTHGWIGPALATLALLACGCGQQGPDEIPRSPNPGTGAARGPVDAGSTSPDISPPPPMEPSPVRDGESDGGRSLEPSNP